MGSLEVPERRGPSGQLPSRVKSCCYGTARAAAGSPPQDSRRMFMLGLATCHSRYARLAFPPQLTCITSQTLPELRWFWSITVYVDPKRGIVTTGRASTIEAAKAQFLANWEKCAVIRLLAAPLCVPDAPVRHQQTSAADMQGRISNFVRVESRCGTGSFSRNHHVPSWMRNTAALAGFLTLSHALHRPDR